MHPRTEHQLTINHQPPNHQPQTAKHQLLINNTSNLTSNAIRNHQPPNTNHQTPTTNHIQCTRVVVVGANANPEATTVES